MVAGGVSDEFREALKYFNIEISLHKARELFTRVGFGAEDDDADDDDDASLGDSGDDEAHIADINEEQFAAAMSLLEHDMATTSMHLMGMSRAQLYLIIAKLSFTLLLIIAFIFVGVAACTQWRGWWGGCWSLWWWLGVAVWAMY